MTFFDEGVVLRRLLVDLPPQRREAFVATQMLGLSYAEAAEVCDCPVGTIRSRVARAREDLIEALNADPHPLSNPHPHPNPHPHSLPHALPRTS